MTIRSTIAFGWLYAALASLEITGELSRNQLLIYCTKPLLTLLLFLFVMQRRPLLGFPSSRLWLMAGLFFAFAGDIFLMIRGINLFVPGLAAFLLMQLCYILAFLSSVKWDSNQTIPVRTWVRAIPFAAYLAVFLLLLHEPLHQKVAYQGLWLPVMAYGLCLCLMGWTAVLRQRQSKPVGSRWVLWGAILFVLSDSLLAINRFVWPLPYEGLLIMSTYAAAQYLIVRGMLSSI